MADDTLQRIFFAVIEHTFVIIVFAALLWQLCRYILDRRRRYRSSSPSDDDDDIPSGLPLFHNTPLDPSLFKFLPSFTYSSSSTTADADESSGSPLECAICLIEFKDHHRGRVLPNCDHIFHLYCIDRWLGSHSTCPLCRRLVDPPRIKSEHENNEASGGEECQLEDASNVNLPPPIRCPKKTIELGGVILEIPDEDPRRR
ncbi:RING-H2 finger protein ATL2-like [Prosopis cineraria]|uniref:RING-H2 finger protein ATL2-like n=1 Tax=Prosopis cineraria TaxID=364024 RepID=UPI00240F046B|nr:RING-H2 finger protein ATL2-like [Prosopis cineraria]